MTVLLPAPMVPSIVIKSCGVEECGADAMALLVASQPTVCQSAVADDARGRRSRARIGREAAKSRPMRRCEFTAIIFRLYISLSRTQAALIAHARVRGAPNLYRPCWATPG